MQAILSASPVRDTAAYALYGAPPTGSGTPENWLAQKQAQAAAGQAAARRSAAARAAQTQQEAALQNRRLIDDRLFGYIAAQRAQFAAQANIIGPALHRLQTEWLARSL